MKNLLMDLIEEYETTEAVKEIFRSFKIWLKTEKGMVI